MNQQCRLCNLRNMPLVNLLRSCAKVVALSLLGLATALDNGVGLTPAMGYNTWDDFRCGGINASNVRKVADAMVRSGLDRVGYRYLGLDDCWATSRNATTGAIVPDPRAFPDGMKAVADYVHKKGLKFGICTLPHAVCSARCLPRCRSTH